MSNLACKSLFKQLATAKTEKELRYIFMDNISQHFVIQRWGIYLTDTHKNLLSYDVHGVSDAFVAKYQKFGVSVDPLMKYVAENHIPVHEEIVLPAGKWKQSELYLRCCIEYDHEHIMTAPIVGKGQMIGTIHFAKIAHTPAFDNFDLFKLGAISSHFSACLASLRTNLLSLRDNSLTELLTKRELQIANLVARGLTNAAIAQELWISQNTVKKALKKMFVKLNVSTRLEMVLKLQDIFWTSNTE